MMNETDKLKSRVAALADQVHAIRRDRVASTTDAELADLLDYALLTSRGAYATGDAKLYQLCEFAVDAILAERRRRNDE